MRHLLRIAALILFFSGSSFLPGAVDSQEPAAHANPPFKQALEQSFYLGNSVFHPEELSGLWEAPDGHGRIIGLQLTLNTAAPNSATKISAIQHQTWLSLEADIYVRTDGTFYPGLSAGFTDSSHGGGLRYEDGRLRAHTQGLDLDLRHLPGNRWTGRIHFTTLFDSQVTLSRPGTAASGKEASFAGTWSFWDNPMQRCLHIVQNTPDDFIAWSDSFQFMGRVMHAPGVTPFSGGSYGELATVRGTGRGKAEINLQPYGGLCCPHPFSASLAKNGTVMKTSWPMAGEWQKVSGDSCIASEPGR